MDDNVKVLMSWFQDFSTIKQELARPLAMLFRKIMDNEIYFAKRNYQWQSCLHRYVDSLRDMSR